MRPASGGGLRLAIPPEQLKFRDEQSVYVRHRAAIRVAEWPPTAAMRAAAENNSDLYVRTVSDYTAV